MKHLIVAAVAAAIALAACAHVDVPTNATPEQVAAAKTAELQANFDQACKYGGGVWQIAKPLAAVPAIAAKIGDKGKLAIAALDSAIRVTCAQPLDLRSASAVTQRIYDAGGAVMALVISDISS